jgi:tetratricopeptide (TPR) repeat protein
MATLRLDSPLDLLTFFFLGETDLAKFAEGAPENTDDRPLLEFAAPLALYADTTDINTQMLREARTAEFPPVSNLPAELLEARRAHFARIYWARGERQEALSQLRKATPPDAEDGAAQLERTKLLFSLGEFARAAEDLDRLARGRLDDRLIRSYLKAAAILRELNAGETVAEHGRTRFGDPNPAEAHNNLGVFYTRLGVRFGEPAFFDLAVDALEAALRVEPQSYAVLNNLGNAYFELGKLDDVVRVYRRVIELAPRLAETRFNLGLVYERQGNTDLAMREFEAAVALKPDWELPRTHLLQMRARPNSVHGSGPESTGW